MQKEEWLSVEWLRNKSRRRQCDWALNSLVLTAHWEWVRESERVGERARSRRALSACVCVCAAVARDICVKIKLMCASKANFRGQPRQRERRRKRAALMLNCCSRCSVAELQRATQRERTTERESVKCPCIAEQQQQKPAGSVYGFHCMAHAMWLGKKYAIFENYTQCSSLAPHMRCSFNPHGALCSAADRFWAQERVPPNVQQRANDKRENERHRENVRERALPKRAELCRALAVRFTPRLVSTSEFLWIQFEFSLRCVQTCSEKTENGKQKVNSALK